MSFSPRMWLQVRKEFEKLPFLSGAFSASLWAAGSKKCECKHSQVRSWAAMNKISVFRHKLLFFPSNLKKLFPFFFFFTIQKNEWGWVFFQHLSKFKHHNVRVGKKKTSLSRELFGWQQFQVAVCGNALLMQSRIPGSVKIFTIWETAACAYVWRGDSWLSKPVITRPDFLWMLPDASADEISRLWCNMVTAHRNCCEQGGGG